MAGSLSGTSRYLKGMPFQARYIRPGDFQSLVILEDYRYTAEVSPAISLHNKLHNKLHL